MQKLGIKIWTRDVIKNKAFFDEAIKAAKDGLFEYIELFVFPNSYADTVDVIKSEMKDTKVIIHNSHSLYGFDAGNKGALENNLRDVNDSKKFADMLGAEIIIVHAGCGEKVENLEETVRQFKIFNDSRIAVENMAYNCSVTGMILNGTLPTQIKQIKDETKCKFCLDFSHATCSANYYGLAVNKFLEEFNNLNPDMYHICDGFSDETTDKHLHFGEGNYDLKHIVNNLIAKDACVTMETGHKPPVNVAPWIQDRNYFHSLIK